MLFVIRLVLVIGPSQLESKKQCLYFVPINPEKSKHT